MQPPISIGTVLQNRYRLVKILGQGGMGRTYLAEDQGRFNELCALKELIPAQTGNDVLEKSKKLFQREASILYQIQHPQVPQFRAMFEQDQRWFLVQDYFQGKTYTTLLNERRAAGHTFSETEVLKLFGHLLPVLAYIHSKGIIHCDISPENIILRDRDRLPVLVDFGVFKELATRWQYSDASRQLTTVGKLGYIPREQVKTGQAYPSSDLYALAVTGVVLLTGREPQKLFDDTQSWNWQRWVTLSPEMNRVLNRMLSSNPGDRYQSVAEVAAALQSLIFPQFPPDPLNQTPDLIQSNTSRLNSIDSVTLEPKHREILDKPWLIVAIGTGVALFTGMGSWTIVSSILNHQRSSGRPAAPQTFPSPVVSESPTPTYTPGSDLPSADRNLK